MIKFEHVVTASPEQLEFIIEGMRNPMNSWDKSDSCYGCFTPFDKLMCKDCESKDNCQTVPDDFMVGDCDLSLMKNLAKAGTDHRKFMRMMPVYVRITAPLYWWKEFDTYKVGTTANSCSTMHKIQEKEFDISDFSCEHLFTEEAVVLEDVIITLNKARAYYNETKDKTWWWQMIQLLPSSYNQTRNVMLNYEVLANIYKSRRNHKLDEWRAFCLWAQELPFAELITV